LLILAQKSPDYFFTGQGVKRDVPHFLHLFGYSEKAVAVNPDLLHYISQRSGSSVVCGDEFALEREDE